VPCSTWISFSYNCS